MLAHADDYGRVTHPTRLPSGAPHLIGQCRSSPQVPAENCPAASGASRADSVLRGVMGMLSIIFRPLNTTVMRLSEAMAVPGWKETIAMVLGMDRNER